MGLTPKCQDNRYKSVYVPKMAFLVSFIYLERVKDFKGQGQGMRINPMSWTLWH